MTEHTDESVKSALNQARVFLDDCIAFLAQDRLRSCVDRGYYSIHFSAVALLASRGIETPRSHRGLVILFGREVVRNGILGDEYSDILSYALRERTDGTYDADAETTADNAQEIVDNAKRFYSAVTALLDC